ncbi:phosphopantothenate--cysteine ligase [Clostridia bacterium]|nr:phosphopantothenate--cysteine ligase [Clostridia bacterium]
MTKPTVLVTAGGCSEKIDAVRRITNTGTGRLGAEIADTLIREKDARITFICTGTSAKPALSCNTIFADTAEELLAAVRTELNRQRYDAFIHSMAVSDYTVEKVCDGNGNVLSGGIGGSEKISSEITAPVIHLRRTPKIIAEIRPLSRDVSPGMKLFGFKLLSGVTEDFLIKEACQLRDRNGCDYVIANLSENVGETTHEAFIIDRNNHAEKLSGKQEIAQRIAGLI